MAAEEKKEPLEVEIIDEIETSVMDPETGELKPVIMVIYRYKNYPPRTIFIPKEEYSEEELKKRIREDIERRLKRRARTLRV